MAGILKEDEEPKKLKKEKVGELKPVFVGKDGKGTVTAANASKLNDGASMLLLMNELGLKETSLKPEFEILSYADAEVDPKDFNIAPNVAVKKALSQINLPTSEIDFWEINEAFSVTALVNMKILGIDRNKINVHGGAVAIGHPIGASGNRIILSLMSVLKEKNGKIGCAAICNGGGGATAIIIKKI